MTNIWPIAHKEYLHLIRDFRSLYLAFAIPLFLIVIFGYALRLDVDNIVTVVLDQDKTDTSRDLIRHLDGSTYFQIVALPPDQHAVDNFLDEGRATMAIIIPPGFAGRLRAERPVPLQVILDGSDPNFANLARSYILAFIERYNHALLLDFLNRQGRERIQPPTEGRIRVWFNEDLESKNFIIPGIMAIIIIIVGALLTSLVIAREFENGTMETLRSLPIGAAEVLIGKAIPYFCIAILDVLLAVAAGQVLFGIVIKSSLWLMLLASVLYLAVALTLGLLISTVTKSQLVANQMAILITYLPSLLLSNFIFPISNMPLVLAKMTYLVPATYYLHILSGLYLKHLGLSHLWPSYLVLLVMAVILASAVYLLLRREGFYR